MLLHELPRLIDGLVAPYPMSAPAPVRRSRHERRQAGHRTPCQYRTRQSPVVPPASHARRCQRCGFALSGCTPRLHAVDSGESARAAVMIRVHEAHIRVAIVFLRGATRMLSTDDLPSTGD
eukprot:3665046-Rhodomonas_salina.2